MKSDNMFLKNGITDWFLNVFGLSVTVDFMSL